MGHIYDRNMHLYQPVSLYQAAASAGSATFTLTKSGNLWYLRCVGGATGEPHAIAVKQVISPYLVLPETRDHLVLPGLECDQRGRGAVSGDRAGGRGRLGIRLGDGCQL